LTKLPGDISLTRQGTTTFKARNCFITDEILDNIVQHTNQYVLIQAHFSLTSDARLTDTIEMKGVVGFRAALRNNKQCLEKLKGTDGDGSEKTSLIDELEIFHVLYRMNS
jgi:hypothetical protein